MKVFTAIAMLATVAVLGAGCGGGGDSDSSDSGSSNSGSSNGSNQQGNGGQQGNMGLSAEVRDCLEEQGVELPQGGGMGNGGQPPAGGQPPEGGDLPTPGSGQGGFQGNEELQKALQECGADMPQGGGGGGFGGNQNSAAFRKSIRAYVSCVRKNGYDLPDPNLSGDGPVFDSDDVDQNDADFQKASEKCQDKLRQQAPQN